MTVNISKCYVFVQQQHRIVTDHLYRLLVPAVQLQKEAREKEETLQRMLSAEKRVRTLEDDNRQLRKEHSEMRKELDKLRKEVCCPCCLVAP